MSFNGNFMCTSFKSELLKGVHDFTPSTGSTFKLALYSNAGAAFDASTTTYRTANEVGNSGSYSAGGGTLTTTATFPKADGTTGIVDFVDLEFTVATITARGAVIYNSSAAGNPAVAVLDFGSDKTSTTGTFTIQFPTGDASTAIIRIA
jgi:hypothetical protein